MNKTFKIKNMTCNSCASRIEEALKDKVENISVSYSKEKAEIDFDEDKISETEIKNIIKQTGYEVVEDKISETEIKDKKESEVVEDKEVPKEKKKAMSENFGMIVLVGSVILLLFILYFLVFARFDVQIPTLGEKSGLILLFFVGILTGFHCVSMCGGFVLSYTTKNAIKGHKGHKQHLIYGGSKLVSYAVIGGIFGLIGGIIAFSIELRGTIAILAGGFMVFYALNMFGFKFFRKFQFNPKFLTKLTSNASKKAKGPYKGPFITGLLSGLFIACGPLQAMYLYAMGSGSFVTGFYSLAVFGLGTLPVMMVFGSIATTISHKATKRILKVSAIIVLILGLIMLNRGLTVMGSPITYDSIKDKIINPVTGNVILTNGYQEINMEVNRYGWEPRSFVLKKGIPAKWNIDVKELTGCNNEIVVPAYNIDIKLKKGLNVVEFTPEKTGTIPWSCWMGMIPGSFVVTETGSASQEQIAEAAPQASGSCGGSCGSPSCGGGGGGGCGCGG